VRDVAGVELTEWLGSNGQGVADTEVDRYRRWSIWAAPNLARVYGLH
jgi:hypothetical protein